MLFHPICDFLYPTTPNACRDVAPTSLQVRITFALPWLFSLVPTQTADSEMINMWDFKLTFFMALSPTYTKFHITQITTRMSNGAWWISTYPVVRQRRSQLLSSPCGPCPCTPSGYNLQLRSYPAPPGASHTGEGITVKNDRCHALYMLACVCLPPHPPVAVGRKRVNPGFWPHQTANRIYKNSYKRNYTKY